jgi:predicted outer membrane repeat protein
MNMKSWVLGMWLAGELFFFIYAGAAQNGAPTPDSVRYVRSSGDDGNDGRSGETPFKTLGRALAEARNGEAGTIIVIGELNGAGEVPGPDGESVFYIDNSGAGELLIRGLDPQAKLSARGSGRRVITITGGARVRLESITLTGGRAAKGGGVFIGEGAALTLGDGVLITGNRAAVDGGGVCIDDASSFVMEDRALVKGNKAAGRQGTGGGLCVGMDSEIVMRGGLVIDNKAKRGAGVYNAFGQFTLEGGSVSGNIAREQGGGICAEQGRVVLNAGALTVNRAASAGGVSVTGEYLRSGGVEIRGNIPEN